jgi:hypothetical protein
MVTSHNANFTRRHYFAQIKQTMKLTLFILTLLSVHLTFSQSKGTISEL